MTAESVQGRPTAEWLRVLDQIDDALARRLEEAPEPPPADEPNRPTNAALDSLVARLSGMQTRVEQAERDAGEADAALGAETEAYRQWTDRMTAARRRLADWAAGGR